jgi:hypothetical protein
MAKKIMKKSKILFLFFLLSIGVCMSGFGQNTSITNNNTITIQGNVYYFRPSTTPSSSQPKVGASNFISYGRWYGADAAKAWASIADWAIEHCERADPPVKGSTGERVYISSVEAIAITAGIDQYDFDYHDHYTHRITVYYWIVASGAQMEDGRRDTRKFKFRIN